MVLISVEGTKAHYKRQLSSILILISQSKWKKTGDTYPMAYVWFMFGILWISEIWRKPTFPQICLLHIILNSLIWLSVINVHFTCKEERCVHLSSLEPTELSIKLSLVWTWIKPLNWVNAHIRCIDTHPFRIDVFTLIYNLCDLLAFLQ